MGPDTLKIILDAVTGPFHRDMDDGGKAVRKFTGEARVELGEFKKFALGVFSVGAAVQFGKEIAGIGIEAADMSRQLQMSAEDLQAYQELFRRNRVEADEYRSAISALRVFQQEALEGDAMAIEMFEKLGISMDELSSKMAPDLFRDVAEGMMEAGDQTAAFMAIAKIFGEDAGPKLIGIFEDLNGMDFEAYKNGLKSSGKVMDEELTQKLAEAESNIQGFMRQVKIFTGNTILGKGGDALKVFQSRAQSGFEDIMERPGRVAGERLIDPFGLVLGRKRRKDRADEILQETTDAEVAREQEIAREKNLREQRTIEAQKRTAEATKAAQEAAEARKKEKEEERAERAALRERQANLKEELKYAELERDPFYVRPAQRVEEVVNSNPFTMEADRKIDALTRELSEVTSLLKRTKLVVADS